MRELISMLIVVIVFTCIFCLFDETHFNGIDEPETLIQKLENRLYFTTSTVSTAGYGDISPKSMECRAVATLLMFIVTLGMVTILVPVKKKKFTFD